MARVPPLAESDWPEELRSVLEARPAALDTWGQHVRIAETLGMDRSEILRVAEGADAAGWSAQDAALVELDEGLEGLPEAGSANS